MAIRGLTTGKARFPTIGKLRKGSAAQGGIGKDLPYFRFTATDTDQKNASDIEAAFVRAYGEKPTRLEVFLPYPEVDENFAAWNEEWSAKGLVHRCDGEVMDQWLDGDKYSRVPKPCPYFTGEKARTKKDTCKPVGRLTVMLPDLIRAGYVGYVTMETHSKHDIITIHNSLTAAREAAGNRPDGIKNIPFYLQRYQASVTMPTEDGGRRKVSKWLCKIEPVPQWVSLQIAAASKATMLMLTDETVTTVNGEWIDDDDDDDAGPNVNDLVEKMREIVPTDKQKAFFGVVRSMYNVKVGADLTVPQALEIIAGLEAGTFKYE